MAIERYIETHAVFTVGELLAECGDGTTNRNLLSRAVRAGRVDKVRRGIYASRCGRFEGLDPDRLEVAGKLFGGCTFAYQTALELYGAAHNPSPSLVTAYGSERLSAEYGGVRYESWPAPNDLQERWVGIGRMATTPERTFADCLDKPDRALGYENVLRSIGALPANPTGCIEAARSIGVAALAKACWALEALGKTDGIEGELDEIAKGRKGFCVLGPHAGRADMEYDARWRLYVPRDARDLAEE